MRLLTQAAGNLLALLLMLYLAYALPQWLPGDFTSATYASSHIVLNADQEAMLRENAPKIPSFLEYIGALAQGDFGDSYAYRTPINALLKEALPWTLTLALGAAFLGAGLGFALGVEATFRRDQAGESYLRYALVALEAIPEILLGLGLWLFFALHLGLFPLQGGESPYSQATGIARIIELAHYGFLPFMTLTLSFMPSFFLLTRVALLPHIHAPYLQSAKSRGISALRRRYIHALPNALMPLLTRLTLRLPSMVFGVVLVEGIFSYPGVGSLLLSAIAKRDLALIQALIILLSCMVIAGNLLLLLLARYFEPRGHKEAR